MKLTAIWMTFWSCFYFIRGSPIAYHRRNNLQTSVNAENILTFMRKFGYLVPNSELTETLYDDDTFVSAIKNMQKYGGLNETGVLDRRTLKLLDRPRCGVTDVRNSILPNRSQRFVLGPSGWRKRRITYFLSNFSPKVGEQKMADSLQKAFRIWSAYSNLKFVQVQDTSADILVAFGSGFHGDNFPFDGPGRVLAHAFYPYELNDYGGDIHFDNDENWKEGAKTMKDGVDFEAVAIHEIGHSLGLAHSTVASSIMFPYYKGLDESSELGFDDIMALYELYIKNSAGIVADDDDEVTQAAHVDQPSKTTVLLHSSQQTTTETILMKTTSKEPTTADREDAPPILCSDFGFNSIASLFGDIFLFKGNYLWRFNENIELQHGYPIRIHDQFKGLPSRIDYIDAAYQRTSDRSVIFFHGRMYWTHDGEKLVGINPQPIADLYFISNTTKIDGAFALNTSNETYLFAGTKYVHFPNQTGATNLRDISDFRGLPNNLDAAITLKDNKMYFFKGNLYWRYDDKLNLEVGYPKRISTNFFKCPRIKCQNMRKTQ